MTTQITPRDWENLSAYLDGQLSASEQSLFESRLENSPELRLVLEELRKARTVLRSLPRLRVPRNFTLTPSMAGLGAGYKASASPYPVLRLASMLATLFFIIVSAGGLALRFSQPAQTVIMRSDQSEMTAPNAPFGMGGGGGGGSNTMPPLPAPTEGEVGVMEQAPLETDVTLLQVTPLAPAAAPITPEEIQSFAMPKSLEAGGVVPGAQAPVAQAAEPILPDTPESEGQSGMELAWNLLTALQIVLALLALVSGLGALYYRRMQNRRL